MMGALCWMGERRELGLVCGPSLGPSPQHRLPLRQAQSLSPTSPVRAAQRGVPPTSGPSGCWVHGLPSPQLWAAHPAHPPQPSHPCLCPHPASPKTPVASLWWAALGAASPALVALLSSPSLSSLPSPPPPRLSGSSQVPGALVRPVSPFCPSAFSANSQGTLRAPFIHSRPCAAPQTQCHGGRSWDDFQEERVTQECGPGAGEGAAPWGEGEELGHLGLGLGLPQGEGARVGNEIRDHHRSLKEYLGTSVGVG